MTELAIDAERAKQLRAAGWSYRAIGRQIAKEQGRPVPYQGQSVQTAVRKSNDKPKIQR